jgi:hypothetical protein
MIPYVLNILVLHMIKTAGASGKILLIISI